jgi:hypothetical protein
MKASALRIAEGRLFADGSELKYFAVRTNLWD